MRWKDLSLACKWYLITIYALATPTIIFCLAGPNTYSTEWVLLTLISLFVSTVNVRLPTISSVISMGDVFTILALTEFGPGPAVILSCLGMIVRQFPHTITRHGCLDFAR